MKIRKTDLLKLNESLKKWIRLTESGEEYDITDGWDNAFKNLKDEDEELYNFMVDTIFSDCSRYKVKKEDILNVKKIDKFFNPTTDLYWQEVKVIYFVEVELKHRNSIYWVFGLTDRGIELNTEFFEEFSSYREAKKYWDNAVKKINSRKDR